MIPLLVLLTGCGSLHSSNSTFELNLSGQKASWSSPKDHTAKGVHFAVNGTNGSSVTFDIAELTSTVTTNSGINDALNGNANANLATAVGDAIEKNVTAVGNVATKIAPMIATGGASALTNK